MNRKIPLFRCIAPVIVASLLATRTEAFEEKTHARLSLRAVQFTSLNSYLQEVLRHEFRDGIQRSFAGKEVQQWIEHGSIEEDNPYWRLQGHFHDPTKPWNQAGTLGMSSVIWSQSLNQGDGVG